MGHFGRFVFFVFLNQIILQSLAATSSPTISYCFLDNYLTPQTFLRDCQLVEISNSAFEFGNITRNTLQILSGRVRLLLLKCTGTNAVVWRVWNFVGAIRLIPVEDVRYYEGTSRTAEIPQYSQWLSIELDHDFSRRLRCESFTDEQSVADVYINAREGQFALNPWKAPWRSAESDTGGYVIQLSTTTSTSHVVPFVAEEFHGDYIQKIKFIKKAKENVTVLGFNASDYDPRIGLRVAGAPDTLSTYEAMYNNSPQIMRSKLTPVIEEPVYVTHDKGKKRFYCNNDNKAARPFRMSFHTCTPIPECKFEFEPMHPRIFKPSIFSSSSLVWDNGYTTHYRHGFAKCYKDDGSTGHGHTMGHSDYFFTGLDGDKYLFSNFSTESVIRISAVNQHTWTDEFQEFHCIISTFVLQPIIVFRVEYEHVNEGIANARGVFLNRLLNESAATLEVHFRLQLSANMSKLSCRAPARHLKEWTSAEITLAVRGQNRNEFPVTGTVAGVIILVLATMVIVIKLRRKYSCFEGLKLRLTEDDVYEFYHGARSQVLNDTVIVPENLAFKEDLKISKSEITIWNIVLQEVRFDIFQRGVFANQQVVVRSCRTHADIEYFKSFLRELKVMAHIGEHPNILKFFGAVVDDIENGLAYAVLELSPYGNLDCYLRTYSNTNQDSDLSSVQFGSSGNEVELSTMLGQATLISFCNQIASGMKYLVEKKGIHSDLAARNVLVFEGNVVKISNFGLATKLYAYSNYINQTQTPLPWQWMALESLRFMEFSSQSDVWSFGVTVWEIFSLGQIPFSGSSWTTEFENQLEAGMRLSKPPLAQQAVYNWMMSCWDNDPVNRPTFSECELFFECLGVVLVDEQE